MANECITTIQLNGNDEAKAKFKEVILKNNLFLIGEGYELQGWQSSEDMFDGITKWGSDHKTVQQIAKDMIAIDPNAVVGVTDEEEGCEIYHAYAFSASCLELPHGDDSPNFRKWNPKEIANKLGYDDVPEMDDVIPYCKWLDKMHSQMCDGLQEIMETKDQRNLRLLVEESLKG